MAKIERSPARGVDPISVDDLIAAGVRDYLEGLTTSSRMFVADQDAQDLFEAVTRAVDAVATGLGEELPKAREALDAIADDGWAGVRR